MDPSIDSREAELEEALLRTGRDVRMSPELRQRTLTALGVGAAALTTTTAAKGAVGWFSGKGGAIVAGLAGACAVAGVLALSSVDVPPAAVEERSSFVDGPQDPLAVDAPAPAEPEEPPTELEEEPPRGEAHTSGQPPATQATTEEATVQRGPQRGASAEPSTLREELSQIARVEAALAARDPDKALALLNDYRQRFRAPKLGLEAEVLTIQALSESGSVAAARKRAASFLEKYPTSPLGARARRYLE